MSRRVRDGASRLVATRVLEYARALAAACHYRTCNLLLRRRVSSLIDAYLREFLDACTYELLHVGSF